MPPGPKIATCDASPRAGSARRHPNPVGAVPFYTQVRCLKVAHTPHKRARREKAYPQFWPQKPRWYGDFSVGLENTRQMFSTCVANPGPTPRSPRDLNAHDLFRNSNEPYFFSGRAFPAGRSALWIDVPQKAKSNTQLYNIITYYSTVWAVQYEVPATRPTRPQGGAGSPHIGENRAWYW